MLFFYGKITAEVCISFPAVLWCSLCYEVLHCNRKTGQVKARQLSQLNPIQTFMYNDSLQLQRDFAKYNTGMHL